MNRLASESGSAGLGDESSSLPALPRVPARRTGRAAVISVDSGRDAACCAGADLTSNLRPSVSLHRITPTSRCTGSLAGLVIPRISEGPDQCRGLIRDLGLLGPSAREALFQEPPHRAVDLCRSPSRIVCIRMGTTDRRIIGLPARRTPLRNQGTRTDR